MRWLFFAFLILITLQANGQNYFYSFEGTGASATVSTVKVKNLTAGATLTLYGNEILHLTGKGEIPWSGSEQNAIIIYPNPVTKDNAVLQIRPPYSGRAFIRICDLTGKIAAQTQVYLGNYVQQFRLSGVSKGFNIIKVIGNGYHYSAKLLWNGTADGPVSLVKISDNNPADENIPENNYGGIQDTVLMFYSIGDRLLFKGISENFSTIIMDIPSGDKKITFPFFSCSDADNNNYTVVEIGSQIWMAENLMTTRYNDGTAIAYPGINDYDWNNNTRGAYAWYDNNEASNKDIYGALYNWKAINTGILCPSDWHVPTDHEWITLSDYLGGTNVAGGKIKDTGTAYWYSPDNKSTNESGFSALPGGMRNLTGFSDIKVGGHWWSSTFYRNLLRPSGWHLSSVSEILDKNITVSANEGLSVRCIIGQSAVSIPFVLTDEIKDISTNSAIVSGMVISDEGATITNFGICWDISKNPTVENQKNSGATAKDNFTANVTGLKPGTIYHVRAYATNSAGTAYGDDLSFTTLTELPVLTTSTVTNIAQTAAESGGNISYDGGGTVTARGVCWATSSSPTISDTRTANGTGTGSFTSSITGLQPGATYHVRAYATNSAGTAYGEDLSFAAQVALPVLTTSPVTNITQTTAASGGNITYDGGGAVMARGVCWSTTVSPTISNARTVNGTGTGSFTSSITGLLPGTTYHVRTYATNSAGTAYGDDLSFTTLIALPVLTTSPATNIRQTTASSGGNITYDGGGTITERGVCWATTFNPTISNNKIIDGSGTGTFTSSITRLQPGTIYHVRAYATNSAGTAYGDDLSLTTLTELPVLTTSAVTIITQTSAASGGNITDDGGRTITERGICWATIAYPTITDARTTNGTGTGSFTSSIIGLQPGTTYHVRAYATNSAGTAYGNDLAFTTAAYLPSLTTMPVTNVAQTTAASGGNITDDGGGSITERGVCWATTASPTISDIRTANGTGTGSFTSSITGLRPGTTFYLRAFATNSAGTAYGNEFSFTTQVALPSLTTSTSTNITQTTAVSGGNITDDGGGLITERGVCWATISNPTISNSKTTDGSGTGSFISTLTGLQPGTDYHVRSYATNSAGTAYGNQVNFSTIPEAPPEVDFYVPGEGKLLHSVGDKKIIFQIVGADAYIKFSNDNGVLYNAGVRVTGIFTEDNKARILGNGNIVLFCGNKIYYSDDNMETINPGIVLNKDGSTYSCHEPVNPAYPGAYFNFMGGFIENAGVCLLGNYSNTSMGASPVNLYYSLDGITWKVIYTFGQDLHYTDNGTAMGGYGGTLLGDPANPLMARHFHSVNIGDDGNFYACTGDGDREIHILKCSYDRGADSWIINDLLSAESVNWQRMRSLGFFERNGYFYWGSDGPGTFTFKGVVYNCFGIYKCPVTDINDPSTHILLQSLSDACYSFLNVGHTVVAGLQSYGYVYISFDYGETWLAYQKPSWMTGSVEGLWFNESQKYFVTRSGVVISSVSF